MEKLTWFKFTISDWMMGKIMKCPEVTQARFIRLCCLYWNKECVLTVDDAEIEIDEDHLKALLGKKVVSTDGDSIQIKFLDEQWADILETSDKRRDAVNKRWEKVNKKNTSVLKSDTSVSNNHTSVLQNDTEKRESREEGKESREDKNHKEFSEKTVSKKKPIKIEDFKEIARLSFVNNNCMFGNDFKKLWLTLIQEKKWRIKSQSAIDASLKKLMAFDEVFAIVLVENSIAGNYQGVVFDNTESNYQKYLLQKDGKSNSKESAIESRNRMAELATAILTGNTA